MLTIVKNNLSDALEARFTEDAPIVPKDVLCDFICGRLHRKGILPNTTTLRADIANESMKCSAPWQEFFVDEVVHETQIKSVCLHIINKDDIFIKEEEIMDLRRINDPMQRAAATTALLKELHDLCDLGTFELIKDKDAKDIPDGIDRKIIGSKFVLKVKYQADGSYLKHKGRLVATGYQQRPGFEFWSTFSPMASLTAVRMMCAEATHRKWTIMHADIPNAFCQSEIDTEILFRFPAGVYIKGKERNQFIRLIKALYGLKQSPALFHRNLIKTLAGDENVIDANGNAGLGFKQANSDTCLFHYQGGNGSVYICAEVDDLVITGEDDDKIRQVKERLEAVYGQTNKIAWEPLHSFLGIDINYNKDKQICTFGVPYKIQKLFDDNPILQSLGEGKKNSITPSDAAEDRQGQNPHVKENFDEAYKDFQSEYGHCCVVHNTSADYNETKDEQLNFWTKAACDYAQRPDGAAFLAGNSPKALNEESAGTKKNELTIDNYLKDNYRSVVGSLIYIMITCRPDLCFAVGKLSRHMHAPEQIHVIWLKRTLRYLRRTQDDKLVYTASNHTHDSDSEQICDIYKKLQGDISTLQVLCGFVDANHANAREAERRSITGFCFFLRGNLISWKSKTQPITAASTHEAELIALSAASDEVLWMRNLLNEVGIKITKPVPILCDNQGTVFTVHNPFINHRSKHLDIRYFRTRQHIRQGFIDVIHCRTHLNLADWFTKSLASKQFYNFKDIIMNSTPRMRELWYAEGRRIRDTQRAEQQMAMQA